MRDIILVTGSFGFIGSNFVRSVAMGHKNYEQVSLDKIERDITLHSEYCNRNYDFHFADVNDRHILSVIMKRYNPKYVVHLAESKTSPVDHSAVARICFENSKNFTKFIYVSSYNVYGAQSSISSPKETETTSEEEIKISSNGEIPCNFIRCCNVMGSRQQTCELIPSIVNYVLNYSGKDILIEDPVVREWAHVDDVISGIMKVLENAPAGEIYNLSSGAEISNLDLANKIVNIIGLPGNVVPTVGKQHYRYSCDSSKLKSLGWQPNFKFHKALESTVNWYTANRWWFRG